MKIGIDISQIVYGTGVSFYTRSLVESLLKLGKKNEYVLFFSSLRQPPPRDFESTNFKFPPLLLEQLWNRLHLLPIEKLIGKVDVFHTSDWLEPPSRCPKVTTIHDLIVYKYPETFKRRGGHDIVANLKHKLEWVKKESTLIISVSESTKKDIVEILKIPEERIRVIYESQNETYNRQPTTNNIKRIKKKYDIKGDYVLTVGTREPRKNLERVIKAYKSTINHQPSTMTFVIVGKFGWGKEPSTINHQPSTIRLLGYVPKEDLPGLYAGAHVFVYPSLYEGFGLPILEAMASGCPVVTSNISSMPEIAGKAAVLVNPKSVEEITQGIEEAIKNRSELIKKGQARAKKFSWEKTARETLKVYKEAASA